MVGDHRQLPPITFSKNAIETNFSRPFFERLFLLFLKNSMVNVHYHMLDVQYRMHHTIRQYPSDQFYEGKIKDAQSVSNREQHRALQNLTKYFKRIVFYDIQSKETCETASNYCNLEQAIFTLNLIEKLFRIGGIEKDGNSSLKDQIGIMAFY